MTETMTSLQSFTRVDGLVAIYVNWVSGNVPYTGLTVTLKRVEAIGLACDGHVGWEIGSPCGRQAKSLLLELGRWSLAESEPAFAGTYRSDDASMGIELHPHDDYPSAEAKRIGDIINRAEQALEEWRKAPTYPWTFDSERPAQ